MSQHRLRQIGDLVICILQPQRGWLRVWQNPGVPSSHWVQEHRWKCIAWAWEAEGDSLSYKLRCPTCDFRLPLVTVTSLIVPMSSSPWIPKFEPAQVHMNPIHHICPGYSLVSTQWNHSLPGNANWLYLFTVVFILTANQRPGEIGIHEFQLFHCYWHLTIWPWRER